MKEPEDRRTFQRSPYPPVRRASAETRGLRSLTGHRLRSSFRVITLKNRASGPSFDAADILRTGGLFGIKGRGLFSCPFSNFYFPAARAPLNCQTKNSITECGSFVPPFNRSSASRSALNPSSNLSFEIFRAF